MNRVFNHGAESEAISQRIVPGAEDLFFIPIGGSDEVGMNLNLYGHAGKWLMVDCGISFDGPESSGVDVVMPDPAFALDHLDELAGIVITHAHEDHVGALPYLWPDLRKPVWCTPFTAGILRRKLLEIDLVGEVDVRIVVAGERFQVGPFDLEFVEITHSIPEANGLMVRTEVGRIFHTGDWKMDRGSAPGEVGYQERFVRLGDEGILALVCDSTNALEEGWSDSEETVRTSLHEVVAAQTKRVVVGCFASNLVRVQSVYDAATANGRKVALAGRSLHRIVEVARETGHMEPSTRFISLSDLQEYPRDQQLILATGSQGEPRAALSRVAAGSHPELELDEGDTVIFSSREIPGNERAIAQIKNRLVRRGVLIIESHDTPIHASGHPNRDELQSMYRCIRPKMLVPVHGEARHLQAQAEFGRSCQIPHGIVPENGMVISLTEDGPKKIATVYSGRLAVEENRLVDVGDAMLRERRKLSISGAASASVALDRKGRILAPVVVELVGLLDEGEEDAIDLQKEFGHYVTQELENQPITRLRSDKDVRELLKRSTRSCLYREFNKRSVVLASVLRINT